MDDLKKFIQEYFAEDFTYNLDLLKSDELKFVADYLTELHSRRGNFRIIKITNDDTKLEIKVEGGIAALKQ